MTRSPRFGMALVYLFMAAMPAYQIISHTDAEVEYLKEAYDTNNFQNNGAIKEVEVWREIASQHHFLGPIIKDFFAPSLNKQFQIPPPREAHAALSRIPYINAQCKSEASLGRFWSLILLLMSLIYFGLAFTRSGKDPSDYIFAFAVISVIFLVTGILAPAMVLVVSPATPIFPHFILHFEVRSIFGVIAELYSSKYWFVALCLTVFSMLIPLAKAGLTIFVLETRSLSIKLKIAVFLHSISKWSMADVFVAAILLSNFAVRANPSTQADLFLGFYFFLSYCLLSLVTTTLLQNKVETHGKKASKTASPRPPARG
ncbi:MAG TPA: paraquat-inducible protein A [bacterium]|nr:paraquat-inducible protein A [bacterium]